ncbi:MAG TPA: hypothetical protein P5277_01435 [Candidatus Paceibacterota bacterium]|nr:hypothetical protein [Candidatus Paceibacterota bacterium]
MKRLSKKIISTGLASVFSISTVLSSPGCATYHEIFRSNEKKNTQPVAIAEGVDYNVGGFKQSHQYKVVNDRAYLPTDITPLQTLEEIIEVPQLKKYIVPAIHGEYVDDGQGGIILTYPCTTPSPDLNNLIKPYFPDIEIVAFSNRNELIFHGKKESFGNNFDRLTLLLNQFDRSAKQVRIRTRIVEYFNDNTYDRELTLKILKEGMNVLSLNLPSNPDISQSLMTGGNFNPIFNVNNYTLDEFSGIKTPTEFTYESAIKFLDSHGKTEILSDTDMLVSNGSSATFKNMNSIPYAAYLVAGTTPIASANYKDVGTEIGITPFANEEGFTTIKLLKANSGEQTGYIGTEQRPTFRQSDFISEMTLKNGVTYFIGTSLNTKYRSVDRGIPLLNKLPLIKHLGMSRSIEKNTSELIYFMEVNIIDKNDLVGTQKILIEPPVKPEKKDPIRDLLLP